MYIRYMIFKDILLLTLFNEPEFISFATSQIVASITIEKSLFNSHLFA